MHNIIENLKIMFKNDIKLDVPLSQFTQWKVGGTAKCIFEPISKFQIQEFIKFMNLHGYKYLVIGETTNLLFSDDGVNIPIMKIGHKLCKVTCDGEFLNCESGVWVPKLARISMQHSLSGLAHIIGIPGTLGGLVCMNGGSQRKGIGSHVVNVEVIDEFGNFKCFSNEECDFSYRHSVFSQHKYTIVSVKLRLDTGDKKQIRAEMLEILRSRNAKFPRKLPNCGSVFVSNPKMYKEFGPPGKIIEESGLKGKEFGGAQISPMHANFIVNIGDATAKDILHLIYLAMTKVKEKTGYSLLAETIFIEPDGTSVPTHVKAMAVWQ